MIVGIETGGTKIVCGVAPDDAPERPSTITSFPTTTPDETFARIGGFIEEATSGEPLRALGIASFGPIDADPGSDRYGWITSTPKAGWQDTDVLAAVHASASVPTAFLHDVAAAAVGEQRFGAAAGGRNVAYATVGTGIGVGIILGRQVLAGSGWPEMGHIPVRRHPADRFDGNCPYHGDCLEGLAAGPAVKARWGADASSLPDAQRDEAIDVLASYLAQLVFTTVIAVGVDRMVLGGGVMHSPGLLERTRAALSGVAGGYGPIQASGDPAALIVAPGLGDRAGVVGALTAAADLLPGAR